MLTTAQSASCQSKRRKVTATSICLFLQVSSSTDFASVTTAATHDHDHPHHHRHHNKHHPLHHPGVTCAKQSRVMPTILTEIIRGVAEGIALGECECSDSSSAHAHHVESEHAHLVESEHSHSPLRFPLQLRG